MSQNSDLKSTNRIKSTALEFHSQRAPVAQKKRGSCPTKLNDFWSPHQKASKAFLRGLQMWTRVLESRPFSRDEKSMADVVGARLASPRAGQALPPTGHPPCRNNAISKSSQGTALDRTVTIVHHKTSRTRLTHLVKAYGLAIPPDQVKDNVLAMSSVSSVAR